MKKSTNTTIDDALVFNFKKYLEKEGNLIPITFGEDTEFAVKRTFLVYDVPEGLIRGSHAHHRCHQILTTITGTVKVCVQDGTKKKSVVLDSPDKAIWVPPGIWAEQEYSEGSILMVMCSHKFTRADYIEDFEVFKEWKKS
jgi:UDP-2-acetamido-3-amino-2,3-dideoxy-glucuronate N-acetyltransferase